MSHKNNKNSKDNKKTSQKTKKEVEKMKNETLRNQENLEKIKLEITHIWDHNN